MELSQAAMDQGLAAALERCVNRFEGFSQHNFDSPNADVLSTVPALNLLPDVLSSIEEQWPSQATALFTEVAAVAVLTRFHLEEPEVSFDSLSELADLLPRVLNSFFHK